MDCALRTIQPPTQIKAPVKRSRSRGNCGLRQLMSNSADQRPSAVSNTQLVVRMLVGVVAPYAHGA